MHHIQRRFFTSAKIKKKERSIVNGVILIAAMRRCFLREKKLYELLCVCECEWAKKKNKNVIARIICTTECATYADGKN